MDNLLEALAKGMNVSIDGISELLGSIKDNTPQLYEQLVREWTYYTVLSKTSFTLFIIVVILAVALVGIYKNCIVDWCGLDYKDVPGDLSRYDYAKVLTQQNVNQNMNTFKKLLTAIIVVLVLAFVVHISKYLLAPNYSIIVDEILPKLSHK
jgi:flagellar biosynthesis protein FlhB|nr:MAG TPA: hypothetical protein [Caudoviricetes sp.]